jgi:hypothetical protein
MTTASTSSVGRGPVATGIADADAAGAMDSTGEAGT